MSTGSIKDLARKAEDSDAAEWGARAGIVARGLLWMVVGVLAVGVAIGSAEKADKGGAFEAMRDQPLGSFVLILLATAFAAHAVFRLLEGTVGRREEDDDKKRMLKRAWSLCRVVIYGFLAFSTVKFLVSGGSSEDAKKSTGQLLGIPAGQTLVTLIGAGVVLTGLVFMVKGVRQDFTKKLDMPGGRMCSVVKRTGQVGLVGRGLVYALVGSFLLQAALTFDPQKAKGLDASLKVLSDQPFGTIMLLLTAFGLLAFAAWSFLEARYRKL